MKKWLLLNTELFFKLKSAHLWHFSFKFTMVALSTGIEISAYQGGKIKYCPIAPLFISVYFAIFLLKLKNFN